MAAPAFRIIELSPDDEKAVNQTAALLIEGFRGHTPTWPDMEKALEGVYESFGENHISRIAVDGQGDVLGWIGGIHHRSVYQGRLWELHPLVVQPSRQGQGIGRALVRDLEEQIAKRGGAVIYLGTDDEDNRTSLGAADLYPNVLEHLQNIRNIKRHPYEFYQKMGYTIVGAMPDANGPGQPDIFMAKRVGR
jgi:aminoglycoside 6'-N-acetyltransferase I